MFALAGTADLDQIFVLDKEVAFFWHAKLETGTF